MKSLPAIVALALSASLASAAPLPASPSPAPRPPAQQSPAPAPKEMPGAEMMTSAEVAKWLGFFDQLVGAVVANQESCEKMANEVSRVIDANHESLTIARSARLQHKKLPESAQQHMLDGVRRMGPGIEKCGDNEHVRAAFAKLDVNDEQSPPPPPAKK